MPASSLGFSNSPAAINPWITQALADGTLTMLLAMPDAALTVLSESHSTAETIAWATLAGDQLDRVAAWGIHRQAQPADFTAATFAMLMTLNEAADAQKLLALNPMTAFVYAMRQCVYSLELPTMTNWLVMGVSAAVSLVGGWILFSRWAPSVIEEL